MKKADLDKKVRGLFQYRQIPELLAASMIRDHKGFERKLIDLQIQIYHLDHQLETQWNITKSSLKPYWKRIHEALRKFGILKKDLADWCKQIEKYQHHELKMREGKWPIDYSFKYLYYYKSCDVKLIRKLIYMYDKSLEDLIPEKDWRYFDYITEINDDIEDVFEDIQTINGNRFLISLILTGPMATKKSFLKEIRALKNEMMEYFKKTRPTAQQKQLHKITQSAFSDTLILLDKRIALKKLSSVDKAIISKYLIKHTSGISRD